MKRIVLLTFCAHIILLAAAQGNKPYYEETTDGKVVFRENSSGNEDKMPHSDSAFNTGFKSYIYFFGGSGYLLNSLNGIVSDNNPDYVKSLRLGLIYGAELSFFLKGTFGIGLKYLIFRSSNSISLIGDEDNISTTFIGPVLSYRQPSRWKTTDFIFGIALGSLTTSNSGSRAGGPFDVDGSSIGGIASIGTDFKFFSNLAIRVDFSVIGGNIKKYNINGIVVTREKPDNQLRTDLRAGLLFFF